MPKICAKDLQIHCHLITLIIVLLNLNRELAMNHVRYSTFL